MNLKLNWTPRLETVRVEKRPEVLIAWYAKMADMMYAEWAAQHSKPGGGRPRRNGNGRASAPGAYPSADSGRLAAETRKGFNSREGYTGTNVFYAKFLDGGTSKMAPRKMYKDALLTVARVERGQGLARYFQWTAS